MVRRNSEDGFEDAVADETGKHPVQSDKCHGAVGVVDNDVGVYSVQQFTEIDKGKQSEEDSREVGQHMEWEIGLTCMIVEKDNAHQQGDDKPDGILFPVAFFEYFIFPA